MGAVDTSSPRPLKLRLNKGVLNCWDPDTNKTTSHKGWEGWLLDWERKDNSANPDPRFRKPSVILTMHDGARPAQLEVPLLSGSFIQFMCSIEHANLRQPIIIRPWTTKEGKTGGVNLYQGMAQITPKYTKKALNGMPPAIEGTDELTGEKTINSTEQMKFLLAIMEGPIRASLSEIKQLEAWEPAPAVVGPMVPAARLEQAAQPMAALPPADTPATTPPEQPAHETGPDEDDLPF